MVYVQILEGDEFREVLALLADTDPCGAAGDLDAPDDQVLATGEVEGVLPGVRAFEYDLGPCFGADGDRLVLRSPLADLQPAPVGVDA